MKNGKNNMAVMILVAAIIAAGAFYGGMSYEKSKTPQPGQRQFNRQGGANGMQPVRGQIISLDATTLTVKLQDGSSKIVTLSNKTTITKATTGSTADLKGGEEVTAFGTKNSDGSVTAQIVTLGGGMFRGGVQSSGAQQK